jgi:hypothetical protein
MTIYRYAARTGTRIGIIDRDVLFPSIMAGLLGLWALIAIAITCGPKLSALETQEPDVKTFVSCEATAPGMPGQLLRCIVEPAVSDSWDM